MHSSQTAPQELPRFLYGFLAVVTALIALASSAVTAKFFIIGLDKIETDAPARDALITAGVLMVITELAAFGLAALLPRSTLRTLRVYLIACGLLLLGFETVTIYVTQVTLAQNAASTAQGSLTKITELRAAIASHKSTADNLRQNGTLQTQSTNSWTRQMGAGALRDSLEATRSSQPLVLELAKLEAEQHSTLVDILGSRGMIYYSLARAFLISAMGLVMFSASGALLRSAIYRPSNRSTSTPGQTNNVPFSAAPSLLSYALRGATHQNFADYSYQNQRVVTGQMIDFNARDLNSSELNFQAHTKAHEHRTSTASSTPSTKNTGSTESTLLTPEHAENIDEFFGDDRFEKLIDEVASGRIKPSVRALQNHLGIGTLLARKYLRQLETIGVTMQFGKGWAKANGQYQA